VFPLKLNEQLNLGELFAFLLKNKVLHVMAIIIIIIFYGGPAFKTQKVLPTSALGPTPLSTTGTTVLGSA
jgi:uncharacterized protein YegL